MAGGGHHPGVHPGRGGPGRLAARRVHACGQARCLLADPRPLHDLWRPMKGLGVVLQTPASCDGRGAAGSQKVLMAMECRRLRGAGALSCGALPQRHGVRAQLHAEFQAMCAV